MRGEEPGMPGTERTVERGWPPTREGLTIQRKVHFESGRRSRKLLVPGPSPSPKPQAPSLPSGSQAPSLPSPPGRVPRLSRLMALAIRFDKLIKSGQIADQAELARLGQVTRASVTQIMDLLHLAPDIQEAMLFLPRTTSGRDPIGERMLRPIAAVLDWRKQRTTATHHLLPGEIAGFIMPQPEWQSATDGAPFLPGLGATAKAGKVPAQDAEPGSPCSGSHLDVGQPAGRFLDRLNKVLATALRVHAFENTRVVKEPATGTKKPEQPCRSRQDAFGPLTCSRVAWEQGPRPVEQAGSGHPSRVPDERGVRFAGPRVGRQAPEQCSFDGPARATSPLR
jgi:hypothetical protein